MKKQRIFAINNNQFVAPNPHTLLTQTTKYLTNGPDNDYFYTVEKAYLGSPTNQSIIDNYANYILGEGLIDETGLIDVEKYISEEDQRLACTDFKMQGACAFQVIYNLGGSLSKLYYLPTKTIAIDRQPDITDAPEAYWYSFDWLQKTKFKPVRYPAFGMGENLETEILYIKRHSPQPLFALPDWQSGIQYCQTEEQLSNYYINHIKNNFSAGKIVNVNQGIPANDEAQEEAEYAIKSQLAGTSNAGSVIVSFNDNKENATTIENIEITDAYSQFQFLSTECVDKIMLSHKVNDKSLFGFVNGSGFSSTAEQMVQSLKILYRSQINPMRKILIKGLEPAFRTINEGIELRFEDFDELKIQTTPAQEQTLRSKIELQSYTDYPQAATENARIALRYAEQNGWGDCGTGVGKARANQLANQEPISEDTISRMASFERHRQYSGKELGDGCGRLMWLAWGGDEGVEWAQRKLEQIRQGDLAAVEFKKWRANPASSNVDRIMYNDESKEMVIKFHGGDYYTYYNIEFDEFSSIFMGEGICRTEGENRWGVWYVGKTPSVGAAVYEILVRSNARYSKGGSLK